MKSWKLTTRIYLVVGMGLTVGGLSTTYLVNRIGRVSAEYNQIIESKLNAAEHSREMQVSFKKEVQEWKNILLRGHDAKDLAKYRDQFAEESADVTKLAKGLAESLDNTEAKTKVKEFLAEHDALQGHYQAALTVFSTATKKDHKVADKMVRGMDRKPTDLIDEVVEILKKDASDFVASEKASVSAQQRVVMVLLLPLFGTVLLLSTMLARSIASRLQKATDLLRKIASENDLTIRFNVDSNDEISEMSRWFNVFTEKLEKMVLTISGNTARVATASEEISSAASQQAAGSDTQKEQTQQVAVAMQEMATTILQVTDSATKAAGAAQKASDTARKGGQVVGVALDKMKTISNSVESSAQKIQKLGENSDQIGEIVGVIDDIADQTNLLALNAAIEAARAGEQGRGFAVVADEVRRLAERTTKATKEIAAMIKNIQTETRDAVSAMEDGTKVVEEGVRSTEQAGASLQEIIIVATQVGDMVTHIASAVSQQSSATEQVNANVEQISKISMEVAAGTQQSARACQDLSNLALDLQNMVGQFKTEESSNGHHVVRPLPVADFSSRRRILEAPVDEKVLSNHN